MSLSSSILNPIMFKSIGGTYPNDYNRLHINRKHGTFMVICYNQPFNKNDVVTLQFSSDVATVPTLRAYNNAILVDTITGAMGVNSPRTGSDGTIYFFNFDITLDSAYFDKPVYFLCTQGADTLTSEPIFVSDISTDIENGIIKKLEYTNYDRIESDLNGFLIDWEDIGTTDNKLFFYIEGIDLDPNDKEDQEELEGAVYSQIVSASYTPGKVFKTNAVPVYMYQRLSACMIEDYIAVNEIEYLKGGSVKKDKFGSSTSFQCEVSLTEKTASIFNVDNEDITEEMREIINHPFLDVITDFDEAPPEGYGLHRVIVEHAATSSGNPATFICGTTVGGTDYVDDIMGVIEETGKTYSFTQHDIPSHVYFGISGAGVKLNIYVQYIIET